MLLSLPLEGNVVLSVSLTRFYSNVTSLDISVKLQQPPSPDSSDPPYVTLIFPLIPWHF